MISSEIQENVPLAPLTTLGVGGPARWFTGAATEDGLRAALDWAGRRGVPAFVLGGGSNLVVSGAGFPGLVVRAALPGIALADADDGRVHATVGAGEDWDGFVRYAAAHNLQGVECLAGIPGSVGATPVQNVGAYGQEVAETIFRVRAFDRETGTIETLGPEECGFAYRRSRFNHDEPGRWVILSVVFALAPGAPPTLRYADLKNHFADALAAGRTPTLLEVYEAVRLIRSRKGMVVRPDDPDSRSAGSFFKNPTVSASEFARVASQAGGDLPHWPQPGGAVKLSAAWLIERSGFRRGEAWGSAGLSSKHILALVNRDGATGEDIAAVARRIQQGVRDAWGVTLAPEPVFLGFASPETLPDHAVRVG